MVGGTKPRDQVETFFMFQPLRAKNLQIFEDTEIKKDMILPYYEKEPTFQGFLLDANDDKEKSSNTKASNEMPSNSNATKDQTRPKPAKQERKSRSGRTVKPSEKAKAQSLQTQELIAHLTKLLDNDWENNNLDVDVDSSTKADAFLTNLGP